MAPLEPATAREQLLLAVWGPPDARLRARQLVKAGGSGAGFGLLFEGCEACSGSIEAGLVVVVVGLVAAFLYWLVTFVYRNIQAYRQRLSPRGATVGRLPLGKRTGLVGTVETGHTSACAPASGRPCVAYALKLLADRHQASAVMLRHSHAVPFSVQLDDGSRLEVPAGRLYLQGPSERVAAEDAAVESHLELELQSEHDLSPIPYDSVEEVVLSPGDRVQIRGKLEREPLAAASSSPYRESRWLYRPKSVLGLKILPSA